MTSSRAMRQPPVGAQRYTGPTRIPTSNGNDSLTLVALGNVQDVGSDGIGESVYTIPTSDVIACAEWAEYADLYQEARVLAFELTYVPRYNAGCPSAYVAPQGTAATSHSPTFSLTTPPSPAALFQYGTARPFNLNRGLRLVWKMDGPDEAHFTPCTSLPNLGGFLWHTGSGTAGQVYGKAYLKWVVQFKGRK